MKKYTLSISLLTILLLSACGGSYTAHQGEIPIIDVETAFQHPQ